MIRKVDLFDRDDGPADRFHPEYESFTDWLNEEAPVDAAVKLRNHTRHRYQRPAVVTVDQLARR